MKLFALTLSIFALALSIFGFVQLLKADVDYDYVCKMHEKTKAIQRSHDEANK